MTLASGKREFPGWAVTAYEQIAHLHEISLVQDEWQYHVQEHNNLDPWNGPRRLCNVY